MTDKLPKSWIECEFEQCIDKINPQNKVKQKEYLRNGKFPVIDQGQDLIGGYCNKEDYVVNVTSPVIIFGDHTRRFKYVDFDFIVGADGVKILKPLSFFDEKLFYYFCKILQFPDKGYSRHFQYLAKSIMRVPPIKEQKRIVHEIEKDFKTIDEEIDKLQKIQDQLGQLKQSILKKAFEGRLVPQDPTDESASVLIEKIKAERNKKMNIYEEYNALNFAKEFIKADEIACKMQGTNTFQRDCLRKALEQLLDNRKTELEEIYQNLLKQNEKKEK